MQNSIFGVPIKLVGEDGNAFSILGRAKKQAREYGVPPEEFTKYSNEAMEGDYDHLLRTTMKYFDVDPSDEDDYIDYEWSNERGR